MFIQWLRPFYAEDTGGGDGDADATGMGDAPTSERPKPSELLARYGNNGDAALRMAERLSAVEGDNFKLRDKNRQLREEITSLRGKAAPEGAVVLTADEAKRWEAYQALGSDPAALKVAITERDEARQRLTSLERDALLRDVAAIGDGTPYKFSVLKDRDTQAGGLIYDVRDVTQDGKTQKAVYIKADGKDVPLADYAQQHWEDYLSALRVGQQAATGTRYVEQSAGGKPPTPQDMVGKRLEQQAERRKAQSNPLMKQRTT